MGEDVRLAELRALLRPGALQCGAEINPDDLHDESLHPREVAPLGVARPRSTDEVVQIAKWASRHQVPLTARGSGTGLSGGAVPVNGGLVVAFSEMNEILRIDADDQVAVVQPGVTLRQLNEALSGRGLTYPVHPGELSGSLGGNVNTNAGGMRAVRYGVTRQRVLGLEAVLMDGTVLRTGGPITKRSSGYDLTQLVVGSEGTLALVTEVTVRLSTAFPASATVLVPYASLDEVTRAVPLIVGSGLEPSILEYIDVLVMAALARAHHLEMGVAATVAERTLAYLVVVLERRTEIEIEADLEVLADLLEKSGALETYVLAPGAGTRLIEAREKAFWGAKAAHANDIVDVVVPRSAVPRFLAHVQELAGLHGVLCTGCGHVGDGNVHLSVFQPDDERRHLFLSALFAEGVALGGAVSGEHGIGRDKQADFLALSDPTSLTLQRAIKDVFDPQGLLNPHRLLDERPLP